MKVTEHPDGKVEVDTGRTAGGGGAKSTATWDGETIATRVLKAEDERRYTLALVYPADKADVAVALDGHRDFASKAVVQDAAWNYMRNHREVGTFHPEFSGMGETGGVAEVVESFLWPGEDWTMKAADGSEQTVRNGDWLAGFIWTPEAWALIKAGKIGGVSPQGKARRRKPDAAAIANLRT